MGRTAPRYSLIPWIVLDQEWLPASLFSRTTIEQAAVAMRERWQQPTKIRTIGSRDYDLSPFQAMDMVLNAHELYLPWPGRATNTAENYFVTRWMSDKIPSFLWAPTSHDAPGGELKLVPGSATSEGGPGMFLSVPGHDSQTPDDTFSRLLNHRIPPPPKPPLPLETLSLGFNLSEAVRDVWPLHGWTIRLGRNRISIGSSDGYWRDLLYQSRGAPIGFRAWEGGYSRHTREIGRKTPELTPMKYLSRNRRVYHVKGTEYDFLCAVGFRCAR